MADTRAIDQQIGAAVHQNRALSKAGLSERMFSRLFRGLVYAQIWEDPVVDMEALQIGPESRLVTIASGGCNMMSYLTEGPASIDVVDLSPAHVALGRLKLTAAQHLDQPEFYHLFARRGATNARIFRRLAPHLDAQTRSWWEARMSLTGRRADMLVNGLYRHGALGRLLGALRLVLWMARIAPEQFLRARDMAEQTRLFEAEIAPLYDRALVRWILKRPSALFGLGIPPQQYDKLAADADGDIVAVLRERTRKLYCDFPASENYFLWQGLTRSYGEEGPVPPYLEPDRFQALAANAGRATLVNRSLGALLAELPDVSRTGYVLLDAQDWMTDRQLTDLWRQITRTAAPGARVIFRTGGAPDILPGRVPGAILGHWRRLDDLGAALFARDRSAIYGGLHVYERAG